MKLKRLRFDLSLFSLSEHIHFSLGCRPFYNVINAKSQSGNNSENSKNDQKNDQLEFSITIRVRRRKLALREIRRRSVCHYFCSPKNLFIFKVYLFSVFLSHARAAAASENCLNVCRLYEIITRFTIQTFRTIL